MNSELVKSLNVLIDETLEELEELKKSRFSASEIKLDGPGSDGIAGKPANGSMGKEEDKDEDEDEDEDDEDDMDKGEGQNRQADPNGPKGSEYRDEYKITKGERNDERNASDKDERKDRESKMDKGEMIAGPSDGSSRGSSPGHNRQADPNGPKGSEYRMDKGEDEEMEMKMKKSQDEMTSLMKSFVDERIKPLEDKLSTIFDLVNKIADQPVAPKGFTARAVVPLSKSTDEFSETLTKSSVTSKLWELKKSGTVVVDSLDVTKAEMGQDLEAIAKKYKIS